MSANNKTDSWDYVDDLDIPDAAPKADEPNIPKSRFDEELAKRDAELKTLRDALQARQQTENGGKTTKDPIAALRAEIETLEDAIDDATDANERKRLRKDLRNKREQYEEARESQVAGRASSASTEQVEYTNTMNAITAEHPQLDVNHDSYNEDLTEEVVAYMTGLMQRKGITRSAALKKAVATLVPETTPKGRDSRKVNALAATAQPPQAVSRSKQKSAGDDIDVANLTLDELGKLTERQLSMLRGDHLD